MTDAFENKGKVEVLGISLDELAIEEGRFQQKITGVIPERLTTADSKVFAAFKCLKEGEISVIITVNGMKPKQQYGEPGRVGTKINVSQVGRVIPVWRDFPIAAAKKGGVHRIMVDVGHEVRVRGDNGLIENDFALDQTFGPFYIEQTAPAKVD